MGVAVDLGERVLVLALGVEHDAQLLAGLRGDRDGEVLGLLVLDYGVAAGELYGQLDGGVALAFDRELAFAVRECRLAVGVFDLDVGQGEGGGDAGLDGAVGDAAADRRARRRQLVARVPGERLAGVDVDGGHQGLGLGQHQASRAPLAAQVHDLDALVEEVLAGGGGVAEPDRRALDDGAVVQAAEGVDGEPRVEVRGGADDDGPAADDLDRGAFDLDAVVELDEVDVVGVRQAGLADDLVGDDGAQLGRGDAAELAALVGHEAAEGGLDAGGVGGGAGELQRRDVPGAEDAGDEVGPRGLSGHLDLVPADAGDFGPAGLDRGRVEPEAFGVLAAFLVAERGRGGAAFEEAVHAAEAEARGDGLEDPGQGAPGRRFLYKGGSGGLLGGRDGARDAAVADDGGRRGGGLDAEADRAGEGFRDAVGGDGGRGRQDGGGGGD
ncbi:MAG: Uncharacterized protein FD126_2527, partial [Elusimicrobia bacterium]